MLFKNPEVLFFLFLLLIPLIIHLFQLQRFKKEAFTNVKFLKKIELESRKSNQLKKLLILITRMLALTALILAFSQPFVNKNKSLQKRESIIYIDNSMSFQAPEKSGIDLLQFSKNSLIDQWNESNQETGLISNQKSFQKLDPKSLQKELISLNFYPVKKDINQVLLQINNQYKDDQETVLDIYMISDFQTINDTINRNFINNRNDYNIIDLSQKQSGNISIDSLWLIKKEGNQASLTAALSSWKMSINDLSVSLHLGNELYGKTSLNMLPDSKAEIEFLLPSDMPDFGKISMTDHRLNFDNELFFTIPKKLKAKVLSVGKPNKFLKRIYHKNEFDLLQTSYDLLDQSIIPDQDLIIINELDIISKPLSQSLANFVQQKGNLVIIPSDSIDLNSYNDMLKTLKAGRVLSKFYENKNVSRINYDHPFFSKVFKKEVFNFQYPTITEGYSGDFKNASSLLQFDDFTDFATEINYFENKVYWIASSLSNPANKFVNSPLIVPLFYNFSVRNENEMALYRIIGETNEINVIMENSNNDIPLKIVRDDYEFIPLQTKLSDQVKITTKDSPLEQGVYELRSKEELIQRLAFNYNRIESNLEFNDLSELAKSFENVHLYDSLNRALKEGNKRNNNKDLWQLFIIFALVFLVLEILLQKFLKN